MKERITVKNNAEIKIADDPSMAEKAAAKIPSVPQTDSTIENGI